MTTRLNVSIPHPVSNEAFRNSFVGVFDVTGNVNFEIFGGFTAGLYYQNSIYKTPANKVRGLNTIARFNNAGLRLGMDAFKSKITLLSGGLTAGTSFIDYLNVVCKTETSSLEKSTKSIFFQPDVSISFFVEDQFAIGVQVAYNINLNEFDPQKICLDQHKPYGEGEEIGITQTLNFGFGLIYTFWSKEGK